MPLAVVKVRDVASGHSTCAVASNCSLSLVRRGDKIEPVTAAKAKTMKFVSSRPAASSETFNQIFGPQGQSGAVASVPQDAPAPAAETPAKPAVHEDKKEEPAPAAAGYHRDVVYTQHGITIEVNADKSVSITQRATGTAIRVSPQGDITLHGEKNIFMSAIENLKVIVEGNAQFDVSGKADITVRETCNLKAMDAVTVNSDASVSIVGAESVSIDGGTGDLEGVITGKSVCPLTGKPHSDPSTNVKASHG